MEPPVLSAVSVQPLHNVLNAAAQIILRKWKFYDITALFEIYYIGWPFSRELNTKCVSWCTSVCIRLHQHTSLKSAHWCLNQPIVVISVQLPGVTLQFHAPEQQDMAKDVAPALWNSLPLFVIHHWHWLSSVRFEDCVIPQSIRNTSIAPTW